MFRNFLKKLAGSKVFCIVFSLLVAIGLWFYIDLVENPEDSKEFRDIPLSFVGQEMLEGRNLMLGEGTDQTVNIVLRGKKILLNRLNKDNIGAYIDLSEIRTTGEKYQGYNITFPDWVDTNAVTVYEWRPRNVSYSIIQRTSREIEVIGRLVGEVADGYLLDAVTCSPAQISVSGPQELIDRIGSAEARVELEEVSSNISTTAGIILLDAEGTEMSKEELLLSTEEVTVNVEVLSIKEVPLMPDINDSGGATSKDVTVTIEPETIKIAGDAATLAGISKLSLGTIDLSKFSTVLEQDMTIYLPDDVMSLTGITRAKVKVEISSDFRTKRLTVDQDSIELTNTEGVNAQIETQSITVTVRAKGEQILDEIDTANIRIVVDLADMAGTKGLVPVKAKVYVDGHKDAGAVGDYTVTILLS